MSTPPRKTRRAWDETGHAHFLTYSCYRRLPLLTRERTRRWVIDAMERTRRELDLAIWAYVIMPEHVHVLLRPNRSEYAMRKILAMLKRRVSEAAKDHLEFTKNTRWLERLTVRYPSRTVFRFWQPGGGYDNNIFKERTVHSVIDYIHANPVRRGLVAHPTEWAWSSSNFWNGCQDVPMRMDEPDV